MTPIDTSEPWILVLGTADWNQAIATNQHYMVRELAQASRVTFVESLGLRQPQFSIRDVKRALARVFNKSANARTEKRPLPDGVDIVSPVVIPVHSGLPRVINRPILRSLLRAWRNHSGPRILWTYSPVTYGLEADASCTVYHCVDLLGEFPGISSAMIDRESARLAEIDVVAIGSSQVVVDHLKKQGFSSILHWPNVADVAVFGSRTGTVDRQPSAVFAGNLTSSKVDFELLRDLVAADVRLHLAGPIAEGGGESTIEQVNDLVNRGAKYHGMLDLKSLAHLYRSATVGVIPYKMNAYTSGVNPLKTFEYLAAGLSVVSTPVPAVQTQPHDVFVTASAEEFVSFVRLNLGAPLSADLIRRSDLADLNSWTERGRAARALVSHLHLGTPRPNAHD